MKLSKMNQLKPYNRWRNKPVCSALLYLMHWARWYCLWLEWKLPISWRSLRRQFPDPNQVCLSTLPGRSDTFPTSSQFHRHISILRIRYCIVWCKIDQKWSAYQDRNSPLRTARARYTDSNRYSFPSRSDLRLVIQGICIDKWGKSLQESNSFSPKEKVDLFLLKLIMHFWKGWC